jgi:hypothetical protein
MPTPPTCINGGNQDHHGQRLRQTVGLSGSVPPDRHISKLQGNATLNNNLTFATTPTASLKITAKTADVDFVVRTIKRPRPIGLTSASNSHSPTHQPCSSPLGGGGARSAAQGSTLNHAANVAPRRPSRFGSGSGVVILDQGRALHRAQQPVGVTGSLTGTSLNLQVAPSSSQTT